MSLIIIFLLLTPAHVLILGDKDIDPLDSGGEPLSTIGWNTLGRMKEAIVVAANEISDLIGTPVNSTDVFSLDNDILVYAWNGSSDTWDQIPFQVDERNTTTDSYGLNNSNGVLDGKDEIVFMSQDAGDQASGNEWVVGCGAPRYEVEITDPDTGDPAWAYIYKSSKIEADFTKDYVRFDTVSDMVFTESYTMGFRDGVGMVMEYFNVTEAKGGDGEDMVDALEFEVFVKLFSVNVTYDENDIADDFILKKDGHVRALGVVNWHIYRNIFGIIVDTYFNFTWRFYQEHVNASGYIDIYIFGPIMVNISIALDHTNTSIPLDYRDLSGNKAVINGTEDENILNTDVQGWWEVSSPHGGYVCVWNIDLQCNSSELKFDDNSSAEDHNNTEPGLFGRTGGLFANISHDQLSYGNLSFFPIASDVSGVAEAFAYNVTHPLLVTATAQHSPTIWVEKGVDVAFAGTGDLVNYTIFFNNTGDRDTNFVWINDTLPADVTFFEHDANMSPYLVSFNQIGATLYFEFLNVPQGVHYFNIAVTVDPSVVPGQTITNRVYLNFTNHVSEQMPESTASASFMISGSNYIILKQGWNLISIPLIQSDTNLSKVLLSIDGLYDAVQWYNITDTLDSWKHFKVGKPFGNDLFELNLTLGFWVHITPPGDTIFLYNGTQPIVNQNIDLYPGWNLVGYPSNTSYNRTDGLNNIIFTTEVDAVWTYNAATQKWKELGPSDYFEIGRGYWVHSKVTKTWIVPL